VTFTPTSLHLSRASSLTVGDTVEVEGIVSNAMGSTYMVEASPSRSPPVNAADQRRHD